jgi:hypothetical protein
MSDGTMNGSGMGTVVRSYFKEGGAVALSVAITVLTFYIFLDIYWMAKEPMSDAAGQVVQARVDAYSRQRDMLTVMVAIFGTVTGWYFGRVPAEKNADAAMQTAKAAKTSEEKTKEMVREELNDLRGDMHLMREDMVPDINRRINQILSKIDRA